MIKVQRKIKNECLDLFIHELAQQIQSKSFIKLPLKQFYPAANQ